MLLQRFAPVALTLTNEHDLHIIKMTFLGQDFQELEPNRTDRHRQTQTDATESIPTPH